MRLVMNGLGFVHIQLLVPADYPARSIRDLFESKRPMTIGTTPPGGSDEWVMRKVFEFYKTTYQDVRSRGGKVIFRILLANVEAVRKVHPAFKDFNPRDAVKLANVPLHPEAERAYREAKLID